MDEEKESVVERVSGVGVKEDGREYYFDVQSFATNSY